MKIFSNTLLVLALIAIFLPIEIFGCACCAERGTYAVSESEIDDYLISVIKDIEFQSSILYTDAGYPESIVGIDPLGERYTISGGLNGKAWNLILKDDMNRAGSLTLWRPAKVEQFMVDRTPLVEHSMVVLYKEMRFSYRAQSATGMFKGGVDSDTHYKLVLQGEGNLCTNASDFDTYFLQVKGKSADYSFFGKLKTVEKSVARQAGAAHGIQPDVL